MHLQNHWILKFSNKETSKVAAYVLRPKKVLLTSPDNIPPNGIIQKRSKINSFGLQNENVKNKKVDNLYNNPYYLSYQWNNIIIIINNNVIIIKLWKGKKYNIGIGNNKNRVIFIFIYKKLFFLH